MVSRKHFFGLGFALMGLLGSKALGDPPGGASVKFLGAKVRLGKKDGMIGGEPVGGIYAQTECKAVFCASQGTLSPTLEQKLMQWHGPIQGYCYICHEAAVAYKKSGILSTFGLVECPSLNPSNRCFRLGMAGKMAAMPSGKSEFKSHAGQDRWDVRASDVAKWLPLVYPVPESLNKEQAIIASQDTEVAGCARDFVHCADGVYIESIPRNPLEPVAVSLYYGLFTWQGNWCVSQAVESWKSVLSTCAKDYGVEHIAVDLVNIAKDHPEVFDTAVYERIMDSFGSLPLSDLSKTLALSKFLRANQKASQEFAEKHCVSPDTYFSYNPHTGKPEPVPFESAAPFRGGFTPRNEVTIPGRLG